MSSWAKPNENPLKWVRSTTGFNRFSLEIAGDFNPRRSGVLLVRPHRPLHLRTPFPRFLDLVPRAPPFPSPHLRQSPYPLAAFAETADEDRKAAGTETPRGGLLQSGFSAGLSEAVHGTPVVEQAESTRVDSPPLPSPARTGPKSLWKTGACGLIFGQSGNGRKQEGARCRI